MSRQQTPAQSPPAKTPPPTVDYFNPAGAARNGPPPPPGKAQLTENLVNEEKSALGVYESGVVLIARVMAVLLHFAGWSLAVSAVVRREPPPARFATDNAVAATANAIERLHFLFETWAPAVLGGVLIAAALLGQVVANSVRTRATIRVAGRLRA